MPRSTTEPASDASASATATAPAVLAYIGLGANLGRPAETIDAAIRALRRLGGTTALRASGLYRSASIGADGPDYLNAVVELRTTLPPPRLLAELQSIEREHGRERSYRNAPRTLDLDLLLHGDSRLVTAALALPHPRLHERAFVLRPLLELAPQLVVPVLGRLEDRLDAVRDQRIERVGPIEAGGDA